MCNISNYKRKNKNDFENAGIYLIKNKINDKKYVGQTYNLKYRWNRHRSDLKNNRHHNKHLQNSWNKYGESNFEYMILERCTLENIDDREIYWISFYDSKNNGYNLANGGLGCRGYKHTPEQILKMRKIQNPEPIIQYSLKGEYIREWYSTSQASKELNIFKLTIENCCKKQQCVKSASGFIWCFKKDELDKEYYLTRKSNCKQINQYDMNFNLIKTWNSVNEIFEKTGFGKAAIRNACKEKTRYSHGFIWRYA